MKDKKISPPPIANLVGYLIAGVDNGHAVFELNPAEYHYNPFATVHGGILSTLLDTTMTASVLSTLSKGFSCTTIEIKVNFIKPVTADTGVLRCEAKPIHIGNRLATVEGRLKNRDGDLHAHGVSTCSIFKIRWSKNNKCRTKLIQPTQKAAQLSSSVEPSQIASHGILVTE